MAVTFGDADSNLLRFQPSNSWNSGDKDSPPVDPEAVDSCDEENQDRSYSSPQPTKECGCLHLGGLSFINKLREQSVVQFSWGTFVKETIYHTFFPLSLPLLFCWEGGPIGLINRQFFSLGGLGFIQWFFGICFCVMNVLVAFNFNAEVVVVDILWMMRSMVLATKYGFISKSEMKGMKEHILPMEIHAGRTLFFAWINPIPLDVLKRQLLLAAIRKDLIDCTCTLRLTPGVAQKVVCLIMRQLSNGSGEQYFLSKSNDRQLVRVLGTSRLSVRRRYCDWCATHDCESSELEARWIKICMSRMREDPEHILPGAQELNGDAENMGTDSMNSLPDNSGNGQKCPALDLPVLMYTAYLLQQSSALLSKKKIFHQIIGYPRRVWWTSYVLAVCHAVIPFAARAVTGDPPIFGTRRWYDYVVSATSFILDTHAMASGIAFMLAGAADFRRRYFAARLLNMILKGGQFVENEDPSTTTKAEKKSSYQMAIQVDFEDPSSIIGWWAMRVLVQDFGRVFYMRVKYYATYFAIYCGLLLAFLVIELLSTSTRTATYLVPLVTYDLIVFTILLALIVFPAGETNEMYHEHGATLARKKLLLKTRLSKPFDSLIHRQNLIYAVDFLQTVSEAVEWENTSAKVTILGFNTGKQVIGVLIGTAGVAIGIAAQQFTSRLSI